MRFHLAATFVASAVLGTAGSAYADNSVSVLHYWTSGGEAAAVDAVKQAFEKAGGTWVDQPVAGGGGDTHDQVLRSRTLSGDAPGAAIPKVSDAIDWYKAGYVVNFDDLAQSESWDAIIPASIAATLKSDGHYVTVPINIHRFNAMWANAEVLAANGIAFPKTWAEFNAAADKLKAAGVIPLAHGGQSWQDEILFEAVAAGVGGADFYNKALVDLDPAALNSDTMLKVFDQYRKLRDYLDPNFSGRDWNLATAMVIKGEAAFQIMGDWAKGEVTAAKLTPGKEILCGPAPTDFPGVYDYVANTFTFFTKTKGEGTPTDGQKLLASVLMTPEAQAAFNLAKGSVPARTGVDLSAFDECAKGSAADLVNADKNGTLVPAFQGGMVNRSEIRGALIDAVTKFFNSNMSSADGVKMLSDSIDLVR